MALYGLLGDIHGNREALGAALAALAERGAKALLCLGDIVGINADPDKCVAMLRERGALSIAGNHDLIGLGRLGLARCSDNAMYSLKRTRRVLAEASARYLARLPDYRVIGESIVLVHGGVRDVEQDMVSIAHIRENLAYLRHDFPEARLCFFGHSHQQKIYEVNGEEVAERVASTRVGLDRAMTYFINPGAVDASRKREHKFAECALLDTEAWAVEFVRVPYDCAATEAKAAAFGYRIPPLVERWYSLRNRLFRRPRFT